MCVNVIMLLCLWSLMCCAVLIIIMIYEYDQLINDHWLTLVHLKNKNLHSDWICDLWIVRYVWFWYVFVWLCEWGWSCIVWFVWEFCWVFVVFFCLSNDFFFFITFNLLLVLILLWFVEMWIFFFWSLTLMIF